MGKVRRMEDNELETGAIRIADEVVSVIAGLAATEVEGVAGMSGGIAGGIAELIGRRNLARGVKVEVGENDAGVDLFLIVNYGASIPEVALEVQKGVRQAIESMTGLMVSHVDIHVQGVHLVRSTEDREIETVEET